jgi:hypothetical protein
MVRHHIAHLALSSGIVLASVAEKWEKQGNSTLSSGKKTSCLDPTNTASLIIAKRLAAFGSGGLWHVEALKYMPRRINGQSSHIRAVQHSIPVNTADYHNARLFYFQASPKIKQYTI